MRLRKDWSIPNHCTGCNRLMRGSHRSAAEFPGTITYSGRGYCTACAFRIRNGVSLTHAIGSARVRQVFTESTLQCDWCLESKPFSSFRVYKKSATGYWWNCRTCDKIKQHRLTYTKFLEFLSKQESCCGVCKIPLIIEPFEDKNWCVDHDHSCCEGVFGCELCVRGLLCRLCNGLLGFAKDDPEVLRNAVAYLTAYSKSDKLESLAPDAALR